jgi:hypothetical protein
MVITPPPKWQLYLGHEQFEFLLVVCQVWVIGYVTSEITAGLNILCLEGVNQVNLHLIEVKGCDEHHGVCCLPQRFCNCFWKTLLCSSLLLLICIFVYKRLAGQLISGEIRLTDIHDCVQAEGGKAKWTSEFQPIERPERLSIEALLSVLHFSGI